MDDRRKERSAMSNSTEAAYFHCRVHQSLYRTEQALRVPGD